MVQRHGEAAAPAGAPASTRELTPIGVVQVQDSANRHLVGVKLAGIYYSGLYRALQTTAIAVGYCDGQNNGHSIIANPGFDFTGAPGLENWANDSKTVAEMAKENDGIATVGMYRKVCPEYTKFMEAKFRENMVNVLADRIIDQPHNVTELADGDVFYIASHSPCGELCALDPNTPALREGDFIVYTFEVEGLRINQVGSEVLYRDR